MNLNQLPHRQRVGLCGGTQLPRPVARFCEFFGSTLARDGCLELVLGGFKHLASKPKTPSADWSYVKGAKSFLDSPQREAAGAQIETLLPDERLESRAIVRFHEGNIRRLIGRSLQARRFQLVNSVDVLVAVEGGNGTRGMIELALALDVPVLLLPFTGGSARALWEENRTTICNWFGIPSTTARHWEKVSLGRLNTLQLQELVHQAVAHLRRQLRRQCLVIMPFRKKFDRLYERALKPAIESVDLEPFRLDRQHLVGSIVDAIRAAATTSVGGVAILTGANPNVTYEIGLMHAQNKPVVLACCRCRGSGRIPKLPFDLSVESVVDYSEKNLQELRSKVQGRLSRLFGKPTPPAIGSPLQAQTKRRKH